MTQGQVTQRTGEPTTADPRTGNPRLSDPRTSDTRTGDLSTGYPSKGDPRTGEPRTGNPRVSDPRTGGPRTFFGVEAGTNFEPSLERLCARVARGPWTILGSRALFENQQSVQMAERNSV